MSGYSRFISCDLPVCVITGLHNRQPIYRLPVYIKHGNAPSGQKVVVVTLTMVMMMMMMMTAAVCVSVR